MSQLTELMNNLAEAIKVQQQQIELMYELRRSVQVKIMQDITDQIVERGYVVTLDGQKAVLRHEAIYDYRFLVAEVLGENGWQLLVPEGSFPSAVQARQAFLEAVPRNFGGSPPATRLISKAHFVRGFGFSKSIPVIFFSLDGLEYDINAHHTSDN